VYHNKLGSQAERNQRVVSIANDIASSLGADSKLAQRAAQLSKTDLLTDMVGEFPELQGIMGTYYAQHDGEHADVATAISEHYQPRFAGDELPRSKVGIAVAIADKLETLVGLFSIGEKPTGDKDPFALRRQALGIIRMLIECKLNISLVTLIELALQQFKVEDKTGVLTSITEFCFDRLSVNLREQGASAQEVDAVLALTPNLLSDIPKRLDAVRVFSALDEAPALAAANKRVGNILKKIEGNVETKKQQTSQSQPSIDNQSLKQMMREVVEEVLSENGLLVESEEKTNEVFTFKNVNAHKRF
jgi:glycyl-tRNA synthetase beta chain